MKVIGYNPRKDQIWIFEAIARFLTEAAGRRWGKTITGLNWLLEGVCEEGGIFWWVAPVYAQCRMAFRRLYNASRGGAQKFIKRESQSEMFFEFINGALLEFKSADKPDNLRGEGIKRAVIDEAAHVKRAVWEEIIRPALSDTRGRALFISTPKGKNWFYEMFNRGQDPLLKEYASMRNPTADNPLILGSDIDNARRDLPADVFSQEYEAEFLDDCAGVFRNVKACAVAFPCGPEKGKVYVAGLDIARVTDFTVLKIFSTDGVEVYSDRFNNLDWNFQIQRLGRKIKEYNAQVLIDSTGVGDPIFEALKNMGLKIEGLHFTNESKKQLVNNLAIELESNGIKIINDPVTVSELGVYEYKMTRHGNIQYGAPDGYHDDTVTALMLAVWKLKNREKYFFGFTDKPLYGRAIH